MEMEIEARHAGTDEIIAMRMRREHNATIMKRQGKQESRSESAVSR